MSETAKFRALLAPFCVGRGAEIGPGGDPIVPEAIRVDLERPYARVGEAEPHLRGTGARLPCFADGELDYLYSSHVLEDFFDTEGVLREWLRVVRPGGHVVLNLPDQALYLRLTPPAIRNENHCRPEFGPRYVRGVIERIGGCEVVLLEDPPPGDYAFPVVIRKTGDPAPRPVVAAAVAEARRALVIECRHVGDVLFATPVIRALALAGYDVDALVAPGTAGILAGHPRLRRAIPWRGDGTAEAIRREGYGLAVVTDLFPWPAEVATFCEIPVRVGYERGARGIWLTTTPSRRTGIHEIESNLDLVRALGIAAAGAEMEVGRVAEAEEWAEAALADRPPPRVLLAPFVSDRHAFKAWPLDRFTAVGRALAREGASVLLDGAPADAPRASALAAEIPGARSTAGETDLPRLVSLLARCDLVIGPDSGPHQIAVAVGTPSVTIWGPIDPRMYGGYGSRHIDLAVEIECGPCYRRGPEWPYRPETCPFAYRCLTDVAVERVVEAARSALAGS